MSSSKPVKTKQWLALLATLFVIVLIAHLAIITSASGQFNNKKSDKTNTFTTRMIELPTLEPVIQKIPDVVTLPKPEKPKAKPVAPEVAPNVTQVINNVLPTVSVQTPLAPTTEPVTTAQTTPEPTQTSPGGTKAASEAAGSPAATTQEPAASIAAPSETGLPPPAFTAQNSGQHAYKVIFTKSGNSNQGKATIKWQQDGEKYQLAMTASMLFIDVFTWGSAGFMSPTGLQPERFSDKRYRKSEVAAHFDRTQNKITFSANTPDAALFIGAQDRISIIWQIAGMLSADPKRYIPGNTFSLQTVSATEAEPWLFTVNEPETLNLENGSQIAQRLTRNPRREFDQKIELWFVSSMNYLPARFRFTETNGDYVDVIWQSVDNLPNTVTH